jgi:protease-4
MDKNTMFILIIVLAVFLVISLTIIFLEYIDTSFGSTVAVIPVQGTITYGGSSLLGEQVTNPDTTKELIGEAEKDASINSILLEINSGGGSAVASEEIMEAVKSCQKPVVAWISDEGASGAYLVASPANRIIASRSSLVGSIGVLLDVTDLSELYKKIGVNRYAIKGGKYKDMGADYRNLTPEEREMLQIMVNEDYDYFISLVAENRNLSKEYVRSIAEGKIYTGKQAKDIKLVDEIGSKDYALDVAARLGGIEGSYNVVTLTPPQTLEEMLANISSQFAYSLGRGIGNFMQKGILSNTSSINFM